MPWALYSVPSAKRTEIDAALRDDLVSRQSQKVRDAAALGGPADRVYVLVEGSEDGVRRAEGLLGALGEQPAEADRLRAKFKEEEEAASAGMGLFFTEG